MNKLQQYNLFSGLQNIEKHKFANDLKQMFSNNSN